VRAALLLSLIVLSNPAGAGQSAPPAPIVRRWIDAAIAHRPGEVDKALLDMAAVSPATFTTLAPDLEQALRQEIRDPEMRNNLRRRGALLHTDLALLQADETAPPGTGAAAAPVTPGRLPGSIRQPARPVPGTLIYSVDGQYVMSFQESPHWPFASWLLAGVRPQPAADEFVRLWYRAVAAMFLSVYRLGNGNYHLQRARAVLPQDPVLHFYRGAVHETLASPRAQSVAASTPRGYAFSGGRVVLSSPVGNIPSERVKLREAERELRAAVRGGGPLEAALRLGRVTTRLGRPADALTLLEQTVPPPDDSRLTYFRDLFLGTTYGALGRVDDARAALERAVARFPTAQSPLMALGDVLRRSGDRARTLDVLRRIEALPADAAARDDPWLDYYRSYAADADLQMARVRAWVDRKAAP
jgi:tetratricopeptide (TPR) repeat protein